METDELDPVLQLNIRSQLADAKLGVAENLSWPLAGFAATTTYLAFESWLLGAGVFACLYILATLKYRRDSAASEDEYHRAAGLGRYYVAKQANDGAEISH